MPSQILIDAKKFFEDYLQSKAPPHEPYTFILTPIGEVPTKEQLLKMMYDRATEVFDEMPFAHLIYSVRYGTPCDYICLPDCNIFITLQIDRSLNWNTRSGIIQGTLRFTSDYIHSNRVQIVRDFTSYSKESGMYSCYKGAQQQFIASLRNKLMLAMPKYL